MTRRRLDVLLVERGLFPSRQQALGAIMAGRVFVDDRRVDKAGTMVPAEARVEVRGEPLPFVSRGGLKLEKALRVFGCDPRDLVVLDVGASTGGFTDCLLQHGAARVYAVDVGYGQLHWRLRNDPRVVVMERTNARHLRRDDFPELMDLVVIDVSFISLAKIFPAVATVIKPGGLMVCLVKPQFEAGPERVGRKGVVDDPAVHRDVLLDVIGSLTANGFVAERITFSPMRGPQGNIEYLLLARWEAVDLGEDRDADVTGAQVMVTQAADVTTSSAVSSDWTRRVEHVVAEAHKAQLPTT